MSVFLSERRTDRLLRNPLDGVHRRDAEDAEETRRDENKALGFGLSLRTL
jgi:hypothetical protein